MNLIKWTIVSALLVIIQGCSSTDKKVDQEVAAEPPVQNRQALRAETDHLIDTMPGLSTDEKTKLHQLRRSVTANINEDNEESLKLRALLITKLITPHYDENEVETIKHKIKGVELKRVTAMLDGADQANRILGRVPRRQAEEQMLNEMIETNGKVY